MMLKVRAWGHLAGENTYKMFYQFSGFDEYMNPYVDGAPVFDCQLMLFTGLKDRDGKEIYEGDVIRVVYPEEDREMMGDDQDYKAIVVFDRGMFILKKGDRFMDTFESSTRWMTVMGSVHENPELVAA